ncbi:hypothetical protein SD70_07895 [Gordoniibacillus kamchatkensis]|uniref:Uncharacterized protein n=1 Tax=Gordoniibacillus kamchatkensis TaxID=1590651 RepID=A0ABR5AJY0_9BACL|nr:hypothetical protein [Paenibacillus sp. VKM B-2647]KIL41354.1 hypothetical protein SD70_07895 [Paenibacillus sp. VKM B-2647]
MKRFVSIGSLFLALMLTFALSGANDAFAKGYSGGSSVSSSRSGGYSGSSSFSSTPSTSTRSGSFTTPGGMGKTSPNTSATTPPSSSSSSGYSTSSKPSGYSTSGSYSGGTTGSYSTGYRGGTYVTPSRGYSGGYVGSTYYPYHSHFLTGVLLGSMLHPFGGYGFGWGPWWGYSLGGHVISPLAIIIDLILIVLVIAIIRRLVFRPRY